MKLSRIEREKMLGTICTIQIQIAPDTTNPSLVCSNLTIHELDADNTCFLISSNLELSPCARLIFAAISVSLLSNL